MPTAQLRLEGQTAGGAVLRLLADRCVCTEHCAVISMCHICRSIAIRPMLPPRLLGIFTVALLVQLNRKRVLEACTLKEPHPCRWYTVLANDVLTAWVRGCVCVCAWVSGGEEAYDICVVGAGPGGLQLGHLLLGQGRDYMIFERNAAAGYA